MSAIDDGVVAFRLARAVETFEEATELAAHQHWNGTANRLYYACFYAVTAWLASRSLSASKHTGVRSLLNRHLIQPGLLPKDHGALFNDLFEIRQEGDYEDFVTQQAEDIAPLIPQVEAFIHHIQHLLAPELDER